MGQVSNHVSSKVFLQFPFLTNDTLKVYLIQRRFRGTSVSPTYNVITKETTLSVIDVEIIDK